MTIAHTTNIHISIDIAGVIRNPRIFVDVRHLCLSCSHPLHTLRVFHRAHGLVRAGVSPGSHGGMRRIVLLCAMFTARIRRWLGATCAQQTQCALSLLLD